MNKIIFAIFLTFLLSSTTFAEPVIMQRNTDKAIGQFFVPDPDKTQVPAQMTGTKVFKKSPSAAELAAGVIDWTSVIAMTVRPTVTTTWYFNDDATKTSTCPADTTTFIGIARTVSKITISFGAGTAEVLGMTN